MVNLLALSQNLYFNTPQLPQDSSQVIRLLLLLLRRLVLSHFLSLSI